MGMLQCTALGWFGALGADGKPQLKDESVTHIRYCLRLFLPCCGGLYPFVPVLVQIKADAEIHVGELQYQSSSKGQTCFQPGECLISLGTRL